MKDTHEPLTIQGKILRYARLRQAAENALKDRKLAKSASLYRESGKLKAEAEAELEAQKNNRTQDEVLAAGARASSLVFG